MLARAVSNFNFCVCGVKWRWLAQLLLCSIAKYESDSVKLSINQVVKSSINK
jgi:hypothetical protein